MIRRIGLFQRQVLVDYLQAHECMTTPIYGNLLTGGLMHNWSSLRSGIYHGIYESGRLKGVMAFFNDGNLMIHTEDAALIPVFQARLPLQPFHSVWGLDMDGHVDQLLEGEPVAIHPVEHWMMVQPQMCQIPVRQDVQFVRADRRPCDPMMISHMQLCLREGFDIDSPEDIIRQRLKERRTEEAHVLISNGQTYVGQAHLQALTAHYGYIGGVTTLARYRGQGYALAVMDHMCRYVHQLGAKPSLTVRKDNVPALNLYRQMGFECCGEVTVLDCQWQI